MDIINVKKAQSIFTSMTNDYVLTLYPSADINDKESFKKLCYILQNRTVMWLASQLNQPYKTFINFGKIQNNQLLLDIISCLSSDETSPEKIRKWWINGGQEWALAHKSENRNFKVPKNMLHTTL